MAVTETLELEEGLRRQLDRDLDAVIVNGTVPRRFTREDLERIALARSDGGDGATSAASDAVRMARAVNDRARVQLAQIARLRRQRSCTARSPPAVPDRAFAPSSALPTVRRPGVVTIPFDLYGTSSTCAASARDLASESLERNSLYSSRVT